MAAIGAASATNMSTVAKKTDLPVLLDVSSQNVWSKIGAPGKEYVWVYNKAGELTAFFKPWEMSLGQTLHYDKLKKLLTQLAK